MKENTVYTCVCVFACVCAHVRACVWVPVSNEDKCHRWWFYWMGWTFPYLWSLISDDGRIGAEIERRIVNASKDFGTIWHYEARDFAFVCVCTLHYKYYSVHIYNIITSSTVASDPSKPYHTPATTTTTAATTTATGSWWLSWWPLGLLW